MITRYLEQQAAVYSALAEKDIKKMPKTLSPSLKILKNHSCRLPIEM